jgi:hypothetical protein
MLSLTPKCTGSIIIAYRPLHGYSLMIHRMLLGPLCDVLRIGGDVVNIWLVI